MNEYRLEIAPMSASDTDVVLAIEQLSQPSPWDRTVFARELACEWAYLDVARTSAGTSDEARVVGYSNYWLVADEVQLHNLAVHPDARRRGVATGLLRHLLGFARAHECALVTLEVRASNLAAQALYQAHGFIHVGQRRGYYADNREDALVMNLRCTTFADS